MTIPLHLLIVDDSEYDAYLLVREVRRGGYDPVFERVETIEAMSVALLQQEWDIVIVDYVMPQFSGLEALRVLKESGKDFPCIMVSGKIGEDVAVEAMKAGAQDYILKDNMSRLIPAISRELYEAVVRHERRKIEDALLKSQEELIRKNEDMRLITVEIEKKNKELEKAYDELKATQAKIIQQEKMASIGQLAAGIAHEINNPVGFIMSNLNTLQKYNDRFSEFIKIQEEVIEELADSAVPLHIAGKLNKHRKSLKINYITEDVHNLIRESIEGTERVKRIVQDLKSFSRVDEAEFKMADINAGIDSTVNVVWNELKYKVTLHKEYGGIPMTKCNPGQLNQVFMNILVNAAHAIEKQGEIILKTWQDDGCINVSIADTGCGIPKDKINRIFEPFFTTKEVGRGTGLGLSIAYEIVKKHNGSISVESEVGKGTTFTIQIPVIKEK